MKAILILTIILLTACQATFAIRPIDAAQESNKMSEKTWACRLFNKCEGGTEK